MNREEEAAHWQQQQQQQLHASRGGAPNPRDAGGSMNTMIPPYPQQERMMMGPDLRYLQEMQRNEEMMLAANRGGGAGIMPGELYASNVARYPSEASGGPPHMSRRSPDGAPYGGGSGDSMPPFRGLVMPPHAAAGNNPYMLLSLLQREQQRLAHNTNPLQESWLPASKRQRHIPPHATAGGMEPAWIPQQQQQAGMHFAAAVQQPEPPKLRKRHVKSFPMKLMETINEHYDESVIAWLPDGKSFVVVDPDLFVENVLSQTFKGGKYSSFVRKLNRWGFSRLISGTGMDCFHNALFQRDRSELCALITSNPERNDTLGVDPNLLGGKPSLAGIEKYFEMKGKDPAKVVSRNRQETTSTTREEEEKHNDEEDEEEEDDRKPAAAAQEQPSESSNTGGDAPEEATHVESV